MRQFVLQELQASPAVQAVIFSVLGVLPWNLKVGPPAVEGRERPASAGPAALATIHDAFGVIGTIFRELEWKYANVVRESGTENSKRTAL